MIKKEKISLLALLCVLLLFHSCGPSTSYEEEEVATDIPISTTSEEALAAFLKGQLQIDLGNFPKSRTHFHKAIELDPNFASAYVYRSWSSGSAEEFANDARAAMKHGAGLIGGEKALIELEAAYLNDNYDAELAASKKMVELHPDAARSHVYLGVAYQNDRKHDKARAAFAKAVELAPDWVGGHNSIANSYMFQEPKDFKKAEEHMMKVVELVSGEPMAHINLGDCYRAQKNLEKALSSYKKASSLDQYDAMAYTKSGHVQTLLGQYDQARESYRKAGSISENKMGAINFEAFTHLYEGNHEAALEFLNKKAMNLEAAGVKESQMTGAKMGCINSCTWIALHHGNVDHIKELLQMRQPVAMQVANDIGNKEARANQNAQIQFWEGIAAAMTGDYEGAVAKADQNKTTLANINDPNKLDNYHFLHGYVNMQQGNYDKAVEHFEQSDKDWIYIKYWLATAHEKNGNTDKAMEMFNDIADWNFNNIGYALIRKEVKEKVEL